MINRTALIGRIQLVRPAYLTIYYRPWRNMSVHKSSAVSEVTIAGITERLQGICKPSSKEGYAAAGVCFFDFAEDGELQVLLSRQKEGKGVQRWTLPGGKRERADIDAEHTAAREAEEELHGQLLAKDLVPLIERSNGIRMPSANYILFFCYLPNQEELPARVAAALKAGQARQEAKKVQGCSWLSLTQLEGLVKKGQAFQDAQALHFFKILGTVLILPTLQAIQGVVKPGVGNQQQGSESRAGSDAAGSKCADELAEALRTHGLSEPATCISVAAAASTSSCCVPATVNIIAVSEATSCAAKGTAVAIAPSAQASEAPGLEYPKTSGSRDQNRPAAEAEPAAAITSISPPAPYASCRSSSTRATDGVAAPKRSAAAANECLNACSKPTLSPTHAVAAPEATSLVAAGESSAVASPGSKHNSSSSSTQQHHRPGQAEAATEQPGASSSCPPTPTPALSGPSSSSSSGSSSPHHLDPNRPIPLIYDLASVRRGKGRPHGRKPDGTNTAGQRYGKLLWGPRPAWLLPSPPQGPDEKDGDGESGAVRVVVPTFSPTCLRPRRQHSDSSSSSSGPRSSSSSGRNSSSSHHTDDSSSSSDDNRSAEQGAMAHTTAGA